MRLRAASSATSRIPCPARGVAAAVLLVLAACAREPAPSLRIAALRQPATSLVFVARSSGCLAREPLRLEERTFELGRDALEELQRGDADVAIAFEAVVARAAQRESGADLRVLATLHRSTRNTRLVAQERAGIRTFADLQGKRLGLARATNADYFADLALRFGGVPRASVRVEDLAPERSVAGLAAGELDAAILSDPFAAEAERVLGGGGRTLSTELYEEFSVVVTRAGVVEAHEPALRSLLRALACAERFARARPDEAAAEVRRRLPEQTEASIRAQLGRVTWSIALDHVLLDVLRDEEEWFAGGVRGGALPAAVIDARLLEQVAPEAVLLLPGVGGGS